MLNLSSPILLALALILILVVFITQGGGDRGDTRALAILSGTLRLNTEVAVTLFSEIDPDGLVEVNIAPLLNLMLPLS